MSIDIQKAQYYADKLTEKGVVVDDYPDWVNHGLSLAALGEAGREIFHKISATSSKYDYKLTDEKFSNLLESKNGTRKIGSFYHFCIDLHHIPKYRIVRNNKGVNDQALPVELNDWL